MKKTLYLFLLCLIAACSGDYKPLDKSDTNDYGKSEDEQELFKRSEAMLAEMKSKGLIIENGPIYDYVTHLGASLLPPQMAKSASIKFFIVRDFKINAFAMANGYVFVNLGMVARLENQLQLAQIMAHESGHVIKRHVFASYESNTTAAQFAQVTDLALLGTGVGYLPYTASIMSHSRDKEFEADEYSAEVLSRMGYELTKSDRLFEVLNEANKDDELEGSIWSDHPADKERAAHLQEYITENNLLLNKGGLIGEKEYAPIKKEAIIENVDLQLINKQYQPAADLLEAEIKLDGNNTILYTLLGDTYRDSKDFDKSLAAYNRAISINPKYSQAWLGRGIDYYNAGKKTESLADLNHYLKTGATTNRRYVIHLVKELQR